jgi:carboxymethylenebutenolidase
MMMDRRTAILTLAAGCVAGSARLERAAAQDLPEAVSFPSRDGRTRLAGYLFKSSHPEPRPAIVLLHGRSGVYSTKANGRYDATTLSQRHLLWGRLWAERGAIALLVDSFAPRGFANGFPRDSYADRPAAVNEVTVRPLDAYGGLAYLAQRRDVDPHRVALQGWSNGGSAALATMADRTLTSLGLGASNGFRAAVAYYPACGLHDAFRDRYAPYAPVRVLIGTDDEEVSPKRCSEFVDASRALGQDIAVTLYPGATHGFDDPGRKRQDVPANAAAFADAKARTLAFLGGHLGL